MRPAARRGRPADVANQEEVGGAPQRTSSHGCAERNPANADAGGPTKGPHTTTRAAPPKDHTQQRGRPRQGTARVCEQMPATAYLTAAWSCAFSFATIGRLRAVLARCLAIAAFDFAAFGLTPLTLLVLNAYLPITQAIASLLTFSALRLMLPRLSHLAW